MPDAQFDPAEFAAFKSSAPPSGTLSNAAGFDPSEFAAFKAQPKGPNFDSDEYVNALAKKHGVDPDYVRGIRDSQGATAFLRGFPIVGGVVDKAGSYLAATAQPLTGAGAAGSSISERAGKNAALINEMRSDFEAAHPTLNTAAQLGGGVVSTAATGGTALGARLLGLTARTLPGQIAAGAASGAVINATDAAVRGNDPVAAGGIGGLVGGAVPPVARLAGAIAQPLVNTVRGMINPAEEALRRVGTGLDRDIASGNAGLTPQEFSSAQQAGTPVNLMDVGGETTRALARSAANTSPEGRAVLNRAIDDRFESQSQRLSDWLDSTFHYPNAAAQQEALEQAAIQTNSANYRRAMQDGSGGLWSPGLERLAGSDAVTAAMQKAAAAAKDESIISGYGAMNPRITFTADGRIQFNRGPNGVPTYPDLQFWDLTRRQLSDAATQAESRGQATEARRLGIFAQNLNTELDRMVPSYAQARAGAASFFGANNALEAGRAYAAPGSKFDNAGTRQALAQMSPNERQLFQDGFVDQFSKQIRALPDRRNVAGAVANSPLAREQMSIALGPQRAAELEAKLHVEAVMDAARGAVQGNSTTVRQLTELGLAGAGGSILSGSNPLDPTSMLNAALIYGAMKGGRAGLGAIDQRVSTQVAQLLTSNNPAHIAMGMKMIGRRPGILDALRNSSVALARSVGVQLQPAAQASQQGQ
jgi:hypothetical protein